MMVNPLVFPFRELITKSVLLFKATQAAVAQAELAMVVAAEYLTVQASEADYSLADFLRTTAQLS